MRAASSTPCWHGEKCAPHGTMAAAATCPSHLPANGSRCAAAPALLAAAVTAAARPPPAPGGAHRCAHLPSIVLQFTSALNCSCCQQLRQLALLPGLPQLWVAHRLWLQQANLRADICHCCRKLSCPGLQHRSLYRCWQLAAGHWSPEQQAGFRRPPACRSRAGCPPQPGKRSGCPPHPLLIAFNMLVTDRPLLILRPLPCPVVLMCAG